MGQDIPDSHFSRHDFVAFARHLRQETALLAEYFRNDRFSSVHNVGGFEIEACLVDQQGLPKPVNDPFLRILNNPDVVTELASFNVELNVNPQVLQNHALRHLHEDLTRTWRECLVAAGKLDAGLMTVGVHPGLHEDELTLANMSHNSRYRALNEQVLASRNSEPIRLDIVGRDHLNTVHYDVMLEAATTSFQIHLQVRQGKAVRAYNAALIASTPLVAASANSPYVFGHDLWAESRIPLFEQAVDVGFKDRKRVTFGQDYVHGSLFGLFEENLDHYPVLLPYDSDEPPEQFAHVKFHNGTIWRWNRPLIGFNQGGVPHLRIENRVVPSGPTIDDMIANAAFFWGLVRTLTDAPEPPELAMKFQTARRNFYNAARHGLDATVCWLEGETIPVRELILDKLLPMAHDGLQYLEINPDDSRKYLGVIEARVTSKQNGAGWQRSWVKRNGKDMKTLSKAYFDWMQTGRPVHEWSI